MLLPHQRFAGDVSFHTLPKFPLTSQELLTTWKGVILTPDLLALGRKPGCSHSIHIICGGCSSKLSTKKNHSSKNSRDLTEIQQRAVCKDDLQWFFIWVKNIPLCKQSLCSNLMGCPGRRHTYKECGICV